MATAIKASPAAPPASAILPLVLVFLCGITVGALVTKVWVHSQQPASMRVLNSMTLERWKRQLNLTPDQAQQIESILDDFSRLYDNVLADGNTRIVRVLDDRQKQIFQTITKDQKR